MRQAIVLGALAVGCGGNSLDVGSANQTKQGDNAGPSKLPSYCVAATKLEDGFEDGINPRWGVTNIDTAVGAGAIDGTKSVHVDATKLSTLFVRPDDGIAPGKSVCVTTLRFRLRVDDALLTSEEAILASIQFGSPYRQLRVVARHGSLVSVFVIDQTPDVAAQPSDLRSLLSLDAVHSFDVEMKVDLGSQLATVSAAPTGQPIPSVAADSIATGQEGDLPRAVTSLWFGDRSLGMNRTPGMPPPTYAGTFLVDDVTVE